MRMLITRRCFLAISPAFFVAACASLPKTPSQGQQDIQAIAGALDGILAAVNGAAPGTIPASTLADIQMAVATAKADALQIANVALAPTDLVSKFVNAASVIVDLATPFLPALAVVAPFIHAMASLLPVISAFFGIAKPSAPRFALMSPDQARLILRASPA